MKAIEFKESNAALGRPPGMTEEQCSGLHIFTDHYVCISCWQPTFIERLRILLTGKIWLGVLSGHTQPPVWVKADYPFLSEVPNAETE